MVDHPYPSPGGVTLLQCAVVAFGVATVTFWFWRGAGWLIGL